ncbi:MAG: phosphomannomutase/phosphoglucomutase [Methylobacter sp.]
MVRLFSLLSAFAVFMVLVVGGCIYWLSAASVGQARQDSVTAVAASLAENLSAQINMRINTVEKMAQDPDVVAAVIGGDPGQLTVVAESLERHFPEVMKVRLLLPGVSELDDKSVPRMGYADLDMVRETLTKNQPPAIQGDMGPDRHLAITRQIMHNEQVVGVILASLGYDFVNKTVQATAPKDGYFELKQGALALAAVGEAPSEAEIADAPKINLASTGWELRYQMADATTSGDFALIFAVIATPALLVLGAFFVGYRTLSQTLTEDLGCVLKASKDMMTNKLQGTYPVKLAEMDAMVSTMLQFKRVLDSEGIEVPDHDTGDSQMNRFFDDFDDPLNSGGSMLWGGDEPESFPVKDETSAPAVSFNKPEIVETTVPDSFDMPMPVKKTADNGAIFRAYDIRGIVGKTLTKDIVYDIGRALGTQAKAQGCKTMVVGCDGRVSSPVLAEALAKGLISTGLNVLDIGRVPTPVLYFVARHTEGRSGVMITGSHNPADYNGLKMVINGETLANQKVQQLKTCIDNQAYASKNPGQIEHNSQYSDEYIGLISEDIHISRPLTVVLDCGNGVAGELGPKLLKALGCNVVELFCDIDGTFPNHHPDPSNPKNLTELIATVKHYKADIGIAFDGDGDRLGVVDSDGKIIWPDRQMMLFAKDVLAAKPGAEIIYDVKCSRHLPEQITKFGGRPTLWKTGHSLMKAKLKETGAKLAGEMSGHIFFNDRWFGFDDALYSAARLLEIMSRDTRSSADVFASFPDSINTPELNIALEEGENFVFIERLLAAANFTDGKITDIDGMRVDFADGWGLVRASNTTPSLVLRFEADSDAAMRRIQQQFGDLMKTIKPNINLPF